MKTSEVNFEIGITKYNRTVNGYLYKREQGADKWTRIGKAEWEQAFEEFMQTKNDLADVQEAENEHEMFSTNPITGETFYHGEWGAEEQEAKKTREAKQKASDKQAEDKLNGKKTSKPRKSKDIAFKTTVTLADDKIADVTLTAKQVNFLKSLRGISFWDDGINSALWCDTIAMDINWNPMSVGAMISTLREKDLIVVTRDDSRQGKPKFMAFTDLGKEVATELGLN